MFRKIVSGIMVFLLLLGMLTLALNIQPVKTSGSIYIRADGSIDPPDAPIQRNGDIYTLTSNIHDSIVVERNKVTVDGDGYTLQGGGSGTGIEIVHRENITIKNMEVNSFEIGIGLWWSSKTCIHRNNIRNSWIGISLHQSLNNSVSQNNVETNEMHGITLAKSSDNYIQGNNATNNDFGMYLWFSYGNTLKNNKMTDNKRGNFGIFGQALSDFPNDIDVSNTVDGKPIYYLVNVENTSVPYDAGYIALINCTNIVVKNVNIESNYQGIALAYTKNSQIAKNNITDNERGVWLFHSVNNEIVENNITASYEGIALEHSCNNNVSGNIILSNGYGIFLSQYSNHNTIHANKMVGNECGVYMCYYANVNTLYHNNFTNNTRHVCNVDSYNIWDDGYPSGGNYWSDYIGVDLHSGPNQDQPGNDGIGDTPCIIDQNNKDNYPLMNLWGLVSGKLEIVKPADASVIVGPVLIDFTIENIGCDVEFLRGDQSNRIDLEVEYPSTDGEISGWGITLWSTSEDGLTLHPREKYTRTVFFDPSEFEEAVPPDFVGNAPYGQAIFRLVHWKQTGEGYDYGEFAIAEIKVELILNASIDVQPKTLNLRSQGKWITAYIELPDGYNVSDIDVSTILLNNTISAELEPATIGDYDNDGIPDLMVRFNRTMVAEYIRSKGVLAGNVTLVMRFHTLRRIMYEGADTVTISDMIGDVNCDGKVTINDIVMAAASYGFTEESPNYNPNANFAQAYEVIDILDLVTIASHYGEENP